MWCDRHLSPLRETWPAGAALAMLGLFNAACRDDRLQAETGGITEKIPDVLRAHRPVCCWLESGIGALGVAERVIQLALDGKVYGKDGQL